MTIIFERILDAEEACISAGGTPEEVRLSMPQYSSLMDELGVLKSGNFGLSQVAVKTGTLKLTVDNYMPSDVIYVGPLISEEWERAGGEDDVTEMFDNDIMQGLEEG